MFRNKYSHLEAVLGERVNVLSRITGQRVEKVIFVELNFDPDIKHLANQGQICRAVL